MKKLLISLKTLIIFSKKSIVFLWKRDPLYIVLILIGVILNSLQAFPSMYLIKYSIDLLARKSGLREYMITISVIVGIMLLIGIISTFIGNNRDNRKSVLRTNISLEMSKICMNVDYELVAEKDFLEKKDFTMDVLNNNKLELVIDSISGIISSILILLGMLYIVSSVSYIILIPLCLAIVCSLYSDFLNANVNFKEDKFKTEIHRKDSYIQSLSQDFSYAKEIRVFNLKDKFFKRMNDLQTLLFETSKQNFKTLRVSILVYYLADYILEMAIYLYLGYQILVLNLITVP
jgi:hypothetical protein